MRRAKNSWIQSVQFGKIYFMTQDVLITTNILMCFNRMYILLLLVQCFTNINVVPLLKVFKCAIVLLIFLKSTYFINYWKRGIAISNSIADLLIFHFSFIFSLLLYWSFITIYFIFPSVFSDTLIYFTDMYIWNSQRLENILLDENQLCFKDLFAQANRIYNHGFICLFHHLCLLWVWIYP